MSDVVVHMSGDESKLWQSYQKIIDQAAKLDGATKKNKQSHEEAFGPKSLQHLVAYAGGLFSIHEGMRKVMEAFKESIAETDLLAGKQRQAAQGLGPLLQLAAVAKHPKEEMERLISESKASFGQGAATDLGAAGVMQFQATSAGLDKYRSQMATLQAINAVRDPQAVFKGISALQTSMGAGATGGFERIMSMGMGASAGAPTKVEEILRAASSAGAAAKELGITPEDLLSGTAVESRVKGDAAEGGTMIYALLRSIEKVGIGQTRRLRRGRTLGQYVGDIAALEAKGISPWKTLGARGEAVEAYRNLRNNPELYAEMQSQVDQAVKNNAFQTMADLATDIPELALPKMAQQGMNRAELAGERAASRGNLERSFLEQRISTVREQGGGEIGVAMEKMWNGLDRLIWRFGGDEDAFLKAARSEAAPELRDAMDKFIEAGQIQLEAAKAHGDVARQRASQKTLPE